LGHLIQDIPVHKLHDHVGYIVHPGIESLQARVSEVHGFRMEHHRLEIYGICAACQAARAEPGRQRPPRRGRRPAIPLPVSPA
jgi:hypothetical protein